MARRKAEENAEEIAARLERDRRKLADSVGEMKERMDPKALAQSGARAVSDGARNVGQAVGDHAGPVVHKAGDMVRAHPVIFALMGAGAAAALIYGLRGSGKAEEKHETPLAGSKFEALSRWEDEGGGISPMPIEDDPEDEAWMAEAEGLRARAGVMLKKIDEALHKGTAPAADLLQHRAEVLSSLTEGVRAAMGRGLEGLGDQARAAQVAAREAAYTARIAVTEKAPEAVRSNPWLAGGLCALAGMALAAVLPRSRGEDQTFGAMRGWLVAAAQKFVGDEVNRAGLAAGFAAGDLAGAVRQERERKRASGTGAEAEEKAPARPTPS